MITVMLEDLDPKFRKIYELRTEAKLKKQAGELTPNEIARWESLPDWTWDLTASEESFLAAVEKSQSQP